MTGTPKTLHQAVDNGLNAILPSQNDRVKATNHIAQHVQDLLAQKFGAAMCSYDDETAKRMAVLFKRILEG